MSEVKRFRADHRHVVETEFDDAQYVGVEDYDAKCHAAEVYFGSWKRTEEERDAAQSELAALREELAEWQGIAGRRTAERTEFMNQRDDAQQRLAAAEQRNATITTLMREGLEEYKNGDDWIDRVIAALRDQPTESGASE